ncbi:MAG: type II secretion system F family protein [Tepidiformaceae bacterium]
MLMILTALCAGAFAMSGVLWFSGVGGASVAASARLNKLRDAQANLPTENASGTRLRRRGAVNFGGITLLSGNLASNWTKDLERAGLTLNAKEYLILRITVSAVLAALVMAVSPVPALGAIGLPLGFFGTGLWLKRKKSSRVHKLEAQMVEMLQMLSSGLRAGFGLLQALEAAAEQAQAPLQTELRRTMRDTAMGASVEQALTSLNERVGSSDFDIVITAILIQRSVGGNLAEILDNVAHTMRERERIRGEIRTLTSQQRLTGYVIGGIPVGLLIVFMMISPEFTSLLFTDPLGQKLLAAAAVSEAIGFVVIQKIVNIEI